MSKPGERFEYSNEGYSLAGAIVERVSGQGYEAFVREHLFIPAGMRETGYQIPAWPLERLPLGYGPEGSEWGRVYKRGWLADGPGWYLRANGGIHASLDDLYRWHVALESTKILSADALAKYQTGHVPSLGGSERYGYGWGVQKTRRGTTVIAHNGGNGFFFTDFRRYIDEKVVIIAMSNQGAIPAAQLASRQIEPLFFNDAPVVTPPSGVDVPREARDRLAGTYTLTGGGTLTVRATDTGLQAEASDPTLFSAMSLTPAGGRFADLERRTQSILQAGAEGNFRPLSEAFDDGRPFAVIQGNQQKYLGRLASRVRRVPEGRGARYGKRAGGSRGERQASLRERWADLAVHLGTATAGRVEKHARDGSRRAHRRVSHDVGVLQLPATQPDHHHLSRRALGDRSPRQPHARREEVKIT